MKTAIIIRTSIFESIDHACKIQEALRYDINKAAPTITLRDNLIQCIRLLNKRGCLRSGQKIGLWFLLKFN